MNHIEVWSHDHTSIYVYERTIMSKRLWDYLHRSEEKVSKLIMFNLEYNFVDRQLMSLATLRTINFTAARLYSERLDQLQAKRLKIKKRLDAWSLFRYSTRYPIWLFVDYLSRKITKESEL